MKPYYFLYFLLVLIAPGCATRGPAGEGSENAQSPDRQEERYLYGGDAFVREGSR
jgi:hypothetical protein